MIIPTYFSSDPAEGYYYSACAPFSCGNLSDISYPFWNTNQPDYCGHPKFKVDCQQDNLTIDIMSQKFDIIGINQTTQIMKIARLDLWVDLSCSKDYTTFNLDFPFFNYTTNDDYTTLFYDCDPPSYYSSPMNGAYALTFPCSIDGDHYAYLVLSTNLGNNFISLGCKNNTTVPVLKEAELSLMKDGITLGPEYVLNEGFEVGWMGVNKDQCDSCIKSSGRCGHNNNASFICLCPNVEKTYDGGNICGITSSQSPLPALDHPFQLPKPNSIGSHQATRYGTPLETGDLHVEISTKKCLSKRELKNYGY
ncbi:unnamed protein product [Lupinus luteus]|uniref:non-specific serine/threonine protein kinase n=1 Tax=Lupinus luteus TaxID=3873 RepID=A0AAV1XMC5_LUPLU